MDTCSCFTSEIGIVLLKLAAGAGLAIPEFGAGALVEAMLSFEMILFNGANEVEMISGMSVTSSKASGRNRV